MVRRIPNTSYLMTDLREAKEHRQRKDTTSDTSVFATNNEMMRRDPVQERIVLGYSASLLIRKSAQGSCSPHGR